MTHGLPGLDRLDSPRPTSLFAKHAAEDALDREPLQTPEGHG